MKTDYEQLEQKFYVLDMKRAALECELEDCHAAFKQLQLDRAKLLTAYNEKCNALIDARIVAGANQDRANDLAAALVFSEKTVEIQKEQLKELTESRDYWRGECYHAEANQIYGRND